MCEPTTEDTVVTAPASDPDYPPPWFRSPESYYPTLPDAVAHFPAGVRSDTYDVAYGRTLGAEWMTRSAGWARDDTDALPVRPIEYRSEAATLERDHAIALATEGRIHTEGTDHLAETLRNASTVAQAEARAEADRRTIDHAARHALIFQGWESI